MNPLTGALMGPGTAALIGQIVPGTGSPTNGIVRAGDGISKYNYEWPALAIAPRFGAAYDLTGRQAMIVRGGVGLFFDRPDGDSIYYQSQNPPTSTNQTVRNGTLQTLGAGGGRGELRRADADQLPLRQSASAVSLQWNTGMQMTLPWSSSLDVAVRRAALLPRAERVPVAHRGEHQRD